MADEAAPSEKSTVYAVTPDDGGGESGGENQAKVAKTRAQMDAEMKAAFLAADIEAESADDIAQRAKAKAAPAPKAKAAPPPPADHEDEDEKADVEEVEADDELDVEIDEDVEAELEADEDEIEKAAAKEDPDLAKRIAAVQKREKRVLEQQAARDRAFAAERDAFVAEWKPRIEKAVATEKRFEELKRNHDLLGILKLLDFPEEAYEEASQELWGLSKTGRSDPKYRDAATRLQEKRNLRAEVSEAKALAKAAQDRLDAQSAQREAQEQADAYMGRVTKAIGDSSPLVKKRLELQPKSTQLMLSKIAIALVKKAGAEVDPKTVVRAYEKKLRAERELARQLGDDAGDDTKTTEPTKKAPAIKVVDKTKKAAPIIETKKPTNGSNGVSFRTRAEMIEDLRKIERGELDPNAD